ncbi:carboxymuconolactone decarboxylase protein (plasmid) [Rhizobium etli]|uniref:Carboxymuconolactone decarboxylase protein n=1 Tax=Rhizobium etli TaxID=29449 RepID=A0AAN1EMR2_RHIET|nr:carboxymuconolactone decarboxylase family protein [Rhizobium etli]ARQ13003.1 carboxymuconolactone decarboxylase protein [Rhizobium etli]
MATVKLLSDQEAAAIPAVQAVFDDIRATRKTDFINDFWRALANDPANLKRVWETLKSVMTVEGAIDPLTREMIYIAVSTANACQYCIQSHTAAARARGMTDAQHGELVSLCRFRPIRNSRCDRKRRSDQAHATSPVRNLPASSNAGVSHSNFV